MDGQGRVAALAVSVLAAVLAPVPAVAAPAVPCPTEKLSPPPKRPPKPKPPVLDPSHARVGGDALATTGLAIPEGAATPPKLTASTWLVADLETGQVLGACGAHGYETPASVQKVLLAATMIPKLDPKQVVQVIREDLDIERGSSAVGLIEGGKYSIETLWYGLLFDSGNDAANVLARVGGGKEGRAGGVAAMNAEARRLGALQTHAVTPSGLDGPGQFTSAYDLVLIARAAFALPDFRKYVATKTAKIPPQPPKDPRGFQIQNDNGLLNKYPGALGGKSGFTTLARHSFVGAAQRNGRTLVAAVLGAEAKPIRASEQTGKLLDWGFALPADASVGRLVEPGEVAEKPTPAPDSQAAAAEGAAPAPERLPGSSPAAVIGLAVAVAAVVLVMLVAAGRRRAVVRARRAALAERRALSDRTSPSLRRPGTVRDDVRGGPRGVGGRGRPRDDVRGGAVRDDGRGARDVAGRGLRDGGRGGAVRDDGRGPRDVAGRGPRDGGRGAPRDGGDRWLEDGRAADGWGPDPGRSPRGGRPPSPRRPADERLWSPEGGGSGADRAPDGRGRTVDERGSGERGSGRSAGEDRGRAPAERRPPVGRRLAGRDEVPDGLYRPPPGDRRSPAERRGSSERGVPGPRQPSADRYPRPDRRPPGQRRPTGDVPLPDSGYAPGDSGYASGDRRARGPAAPDPYRPPKPDERWP